MIHNHAVDETIETGVLIIGGGAAACMAAIRSDTVGAPTLMVDKGQLGKSGCSPNAHGGMAIHHKDPEDSWRVHFNDTLLSGGFLNDQHIVEILCKKGPKFIQILEQFGSLVDRDDDGSISVRQFGGHTFSRSVFSGDETGHEMMAGLRREIYRRGIRCLDETMAIRLVTADGEVVGAFCWNIPSGKTLYIKATSVILATADSAGIWPAASERQRGDGYCMALDAGAELTDMEFIQYHPTHAWWPYGVRGSVSESFRSEGGYLLNGEGERFMANYDPERMELATRDMISVAIHKEIRAGRGSKHGGIYATVAHLPAKQVEERLRVIFRKYMSYGYDVRKHPIEVRPRPHYHCGGICINTRCESTVPGLYAAGAVTAGVHGANRLGSNSLTDILVFGEIAGQQAANRALERRGVLSENQSIAADELQRIGQLLDTAPDDAITTPALRRRHIEMMDEYMGVLRTQEGMEHMLAEIERSKRTDLPRLTVRESSRAYNFELLDALEMSYRLEVEEMATRAALMRTESRGTHYREDFPERNDTEWLKNIVFSKRDGEFHVAVQDRDLPITRPAEFPEYAATTSPWH